MNAYATVPFLFLTLLQYNHDKQVVQKFREEGKMPYPDTYQPEEDMQEVQTVCDVAEDGSLRFQNGVSLQDQNLILRRIRQIRDTLDNSVRQLYGKNEEVTKWADELGGLRKVQEKLCGLKLDKKSWYNKTLKLLKDELGYDVPALGEPIQEVPPDSATSHSGYAVEVHRTMINRKAHGEVEDDDETTPNWAATIFDFPISNKPFWWSGVSMGRFRKGTMKPSKNLIQKETGSGPAWLPDIRISKEIGDRHFKKLTDLAPWWQMQDHPVVKEFIWKFYNDPSLLEHKRIGVEPKTRWAFGMVCKSGYIWAPVTYQSDKTIKYFSKPKEDKKPYIKRALYLGPWVVVYSKVGDQKIRVQKLRQDEHTGLWAKHKDVIMAPQEWGQMKRKILKAGATDAYFGYPWRKYQAPKQDVNEVL